MRATPFGSGDHADERDRLRGGRRLTWVTAAAPEPPVASIGSSTQRAAARHRRELRVVVAGLVASPRRAPCRGSPTTVSGYRSVDGVEQTRARLGARGSRRGCSASAVPLDRLQRRLDRDRLDREVARGLDHEEPPEPPRERAEVAPGPVARSRSRVRRSPASGWSSTGAAIGADASRGRADVGQVACQARARSAHHEPPRCSTLRGFWFCLRRARPGVVASSHRAASDPGPEPGVFTSPGARRTGRTRRTTHGRGDDGGGHRGRHRGRLREGARRRRRGVRLARRRCTRSSGSSATPSGSRRSRSRSCPASTT